MLARHLKSIVCLAFLLSGCMAMSESECRNTDWFKLAEYEALNYGVRPQIDQYAHLCGRYNITVSEKDYMTGWLDGYREWSRRSNGGDGFE